MLTSRITSSAPHGGDHTLCQMDDQAILPRVIHSAGMTPHVEGNPALAAAHPSPRPMHHLAQAISKVAKFMFEVLLSAALFCAHPSLFWIGFVCGLILNSEISSCCHKVAKVWNKNWMTRGVILGLMIMAFPAALGTSCFMMGGFVGTRFSVDL